MTLRPITPTDSDTVEPDKQFRIGLDCIQDAYDRKMALMLDELTQWKEIANTQKQKISTLESDLSTNKEKILDLEASVAKQSGEIELLKSSNTGLTNKLEKMRKYTLELETFRKSILDTVEYSSAKSLQLSDFSESIEKIESTVGQRVTRNEGGASPQKGFHPGRKVGKAPVDSGSENRPNSRESQQKNIKHLEEDKMSNAVENRMTANSDLENEIPKENSPKGRKKNGASPLPVRGSIVTRDVMVDAQEIAVPIEPSVVYRNVRKELSSDEFQQFIEIIGEMTSNSATVEKTLTKVEVLLKGKPQGQSLITQMRTLILKSIEEPTLPSSSNEVKESKGTIFQK